jgi:hypothetical protein
MGGILGQMEGRSVVLVVLVVWHSTFTSLVRATLREASLDKFKVGLGYVGII